MKITFRIHYQTKWGEQIAVTGSIAELGNGDIGKAFRLQHTGGGYWEHSLETEARKSDITYRYLLVNDSGEVIREDWGPPRILPLPKKDLQLVVLNDSWRSAHHADNSFYTSAFKDVIFKPGKFPAKTSQPADGALSLRFRIHAPRIAPHLQFCVCGNIPELGNWDLEKPLLLGNDHFPLWSGAVQLMPSSAIAYKYGIYDPSQKRVLSLETGSNRLLFREAIPDQADELVITDEYYRYPQVHWKGAGVAIPVFSLRSQTGFGVGEFTDIKLLVDWARSVSMKMVQILPVNDTSAKLNWKDSYPYAAISVFALHPLYLNVDSLDGFDKVIDRKKFDKEQKKLNSLPVVDYEQVSQSKLKYARQVFNHQKEAFLQEEAFLQFMRENEHWLKPYALFCALRDQYKTANFHQWKSDRQYYAEKLAKASDPSSPLYEKMAFYYYLQYHLDRQLRDAADHARQHGIVLKGDIPIGIYRHSVDAWTDPDLYNMNGQAGAPPDPFSDIGQNWGFPTYNWEEMSKDGYQWWQNRLKQLSRYFDAFRIDHILGFFRIWEIPVGQVEGTMGFFNPALPVQLSEFKDRGILFNQARFCQPYLTASLLHETFGQDADFVLETFLEQGPAGNYQFQPAFDNQRKIEAFFQDPAQAGRQHLKDPLFKLISNILFFEVPGSSGQQFHPRIDLQKTSSFKALDRGTQQKIDDLYVHYFYRRQDDFWKEQAMTKLPAIKGATNMLICGEDLGMVPHCVPEVMKDLEILTLEIQRMSKNPETEFLQSRDIPYLSVISPSTHDMSPLRLWWEEMEPDQVRRYYRQELQFEGEPPAHCETYVVERIIQQHLSWPGMWTVFAIQDLLGLSQAFRRENPADERINIPANPEHYWQYRLHLTMRELMDARELNDKLRQLLSVTGRG